jgi:hypothetical protein
MAMDDVVTVLSNARALVARGWVQGQMAADARGETVNPSDPGACRWCPLGAIAAQSSRASCAVTGRAKDLLRQAIRLGSGDRQAEISTYTDAPGRTLAEVLAVLDAALGLARGKA